MITEALLARFDHVRPRGPGRWAAPCSAHDDRTPSLSITEGERGLLLKCWAGCSIEEICRSIGIEQRDLFYDEQGSDPRRRRDAAQRRALRDEERIRRGHFIDSCKLAERFLESRRGIDISVWSNDRLDRELDLVADAHQLLERDPYGY